MSAQQQNMVPSEDGDTIEIPGLSDARPPEDEIESSESNPFSCNICKRSYTRVDHLARHYRSHTREKPFVCEICGKSFARADLLKRHANGHNPDNADLRLKGSAKPAHPRTARACLTCAEAKLRCEGNSPCARCKNRGITCEYGQPRPRRSMSSANRQNGGRTSLSSNPTTSSSFQMGVPGQQDQYQSSNAPVPPFTQQADSDMMMLDPIVTDQWPHSVPTHPHLTLDENQLPTPTGFDHGNEGSGPGAMPPEVSASTVIHPGSLSQEPVSAGRFNELPFADFLRHVMTPAPHNGSRPIDADTFQPYCHDLLDFNVDQPFEIDLNGFAPNLFVPDQVFQSAAVRFDGDEFPPPKGGYSTPGNLIHGSVTVGQQAFKDSIWLWTPALGDQAGTENANLSLSIDHSLLNTEGTDATLAQGQLNLSTRDRILSMVLSTCNASSSLLVVACFPSPELLKKLLNISLVHHLRGDAPWIHQATLSINEEPPEFLAAMIAMGATACPIPKIRKLGFALQEAVRLALPEKFEADNRNTRELRLLQAYTLHLDVSLWSGDRRKMEIAESFALPLVTMMRRAGSFRRNRHSEIVLRQSDDEKTTESKWRRWTEAESFKRLALYLFLRDTQTSISLLDQPLISFAELTLDLPYSRELWMAKSASEWKALYLANIGDTQDHPPSFRHCLHDTGTIFRLQHIVDVQMALGVILSSIWAIIWQYRKMKEALTFHDKGISRNNSLTVNSLHQEAMHLIQHVSLNATEWQVDMKAPATLLRELCLMHLHVSLEDVQLLAGKEGEEEARRVFPLLSDWAESAESRQAIFHAGQVIRAAKQYTNGALRDASAVAVYQASLAFWAYAVPYKTVTTGKAAPSSCPPQLSSPNDQTPESVRLDADDGPDLRRFLVLGKGSPCLHRWTEYDGSVPDQDVPLADPVAVMNAITELLHKKSGGNENSSPPLVMNLSKLMKSLGTAAAAVRKM